MKHYTEYSQEKRNLFVKPEYNKRIYLENMDKMQNTKNVKKYIFWDTITEEVWIIPARPTIFVKTQNKKEINKYCKTSYTIYAKLSWHIYNDCKDRKVYKLQVATPMLVPQNA